MKRLAVIALFLGFAGCTASTSEDLSGVVCYDTGTGLKCVPHDQVPRNATVTCEGGDADTGGSNSSISNNGSDSGSDTDGDGNSDSSDGGAHADDSEGDSDSSAAGGGDCGGSQSDDDSDGVANGQDCDCTGPGGGDGGGTPPTDPPPDTGTGTTGPL